MYIIAIMYQLKNYMLSMQSNWFVNQALVDAVEQTMPMIAKFAVSQGVETLGITPAAKMCKEIYPCVHRFPLFRRSWCKMLVKEIKKMEKEAQFKPNPDEDELRQIPEIVLQHECPELFERMWFTVNTIINPVIHSIYNRDVYDISSVQIANYNPKDKKKGAWHHDESADISIVVPLNTGDYVGGGTEFARHGIVKPLPTGHALMFPSATHLHRGLAVESGDRYLLVFWLYSKSRLSDLCENVG